MLADAFFGGERRGEVRRGEYRRGEARRLFSVVRVASLIPPVVTVL